MLFVLIMPVVLVVRTHNYWPTEKMIYE